LDSGGSAVMGSGILALWDRELLPRVVFACGFLLLRVLASAIIYFGLLRRYSNIYNKGTRVETTRYPEKYVSIGAVPPPQIYATCRLLLWFGYVLIGKNADVYLIKYTRRHPHLHPHHGAQQISGT